MTELVHAISKVTTDVVFRLSPEQVIFAMSQMDGLKGDQFLLCQMKVTQMFSTYDFIGLRPAANEIVLGLKADSFSKALKNITDKTTLILKLTGRGPTGAQLEINIQQVYPKLNYLDLI